MKEEITELTKEQEKQLAVYRDKWLKIGLSTEDFTFEKAKEISDFYYEKVLGKESVPVIVMDSPYSAWLAVCMLSDGQVWEQVVGQVYDQVHEQVYNQVGEQAREQIWEQVRGQIQKQVNEQISQQVGGQVRGQVWRQVNEQVEEQVEEQVREQIWEQVSEQIKEQVNDQVRKQVVGQVVGQVYDQVYDQVHKQISEQVWNQTGEQVGEQVYEQVGEQVRGQVENQFPSFVYPCIDGNFSAGYFANYAFMNEVLGIDFPCKEKWEWYKSTTKIGLFYPLENVCVISRKPIEINMKDGKLHADGKPAIKYKDGFSVWALNGVVVPQYLAETPATKLDIDFFKNEKNADVKAEFIRKYGIDRMVDMGKLVDTYLNHKDTINYEWYKKSEYKLIDMSPIFQTFNYLPYLYMANQTVKGVYHLECCYDPNTTRQPRTILEALRVRLNGVDPESLEIIDIK